MLLMTPNLVVGRNKAHVRELCAKYPHIKVESAADFFDKLRNLAFLQNCGLCLDEKATLLLAQNSLLKRKNYSLHLAPHFASLYSSFLHGITRPSELFAKSIMLDDDLHQLVCVLKDIEHGMKQHGLVNKVGALFNAQQIIKEQQMLPPSFFKGQHIALWYLVDLTMLEIEVIKSLSKLKISFDIILPLDFQKRGINQAVDFIASQFEADESLENINLHFVKLSHTGRLKPLIDNLFNDSEAINFDSNVVSISSYANLNEEAEEIAEKITFLKTKKEDASIALAVPTIDARSLIFKKALERFHIKVSDRKGISLRETLAGRLLFILIGARLNALKESELITLLSHRLSKFYIDSFNDYAELCDVINKIGIDDNIYINKNILFRYQDKISRFLRVYDNGSIEHINALKLLELINTISSYLEVIKSENSFLGHIASIEELLDKCMLGQPDDESLPSLKSTLSSFSKSTVASNQPISLAHFITILEKELSLEILPSEETNEISDVEFLLIPELLGRHFDHVFIVDISLARLPQNMPKDPICNDQMRIKINQQAKRPVLRVFFDDPFEPMLVPPRQALEPFWFASAIASAKESLTFSYAYLDEKGEEQAPSEFFIWLKEHIKNNEKLERAKCISNEYAQFLLGQTKTADVCRPYVLSLQQRKVAFKQKHSSEFAFLFNQEDVETIMAGRLNPVPTRALTPTFIESFASCPYFGLLDRVLNLNESKNDHYKDIDLRVIGKLAHSALEKFFSKTHKDYAKSLNQIIAELSKDYLRKNYVCDLDLFSCQIEWLKISLFGVVEKLLSINNETGFSIIATELAFLGEGLNSVLITVNTHSYLLGGIVDRIDKLDDQFLVIDYKLSSSDHLRLASGTKAFLNTHFQIPIYLRLVASHFANNDREKLAFRFVSLRDGELLPLLSNEQHQPMFQKIFDDEQEGSLAQRIDEIFSDIRKGSILAKVGEHCSTCSYSFVCRAKEGC